MKIVLDQANSDVMFLHCLPAIKGQEISTTLLDDQRSRVWRQAENRLHALKRTSFRTLKLIYLSELLKLPLSIRDNYLSPPQE